MNKKSNNRIKLINMSYQQPYRVMDEKYFDILAKQIRGLIDPSILWPVFRKYPQLNNQNMNQLRNSLRKSCEI